MRLTRVLNQYAGTRENLIWKMKLVRRRQGFILDPNLSPEDAVFAAKAGLKVEDPNLLWLPKKRFPEWIPPKGLDYKPLDIDHEDYKSDAIHTFDMDSKLLEGLNQVQILTKTQANFGLPNVVNDRLGKITIPYQDELAQRYIMQSHLWASEKIQINRHRLPETPIIWKMKREYGNPEKLIIYNLMNSLVRMFNTQRALYPSLDQCSLTRDHSVTSHFEYEEGRPIVISNTYPMMLSSKKSLPAFANKEEVANTQNLNLPDIFPVSPMIDLKTTNVWKLEQNNGWPTPENHEQHLHTAFQDLLDYDPRATGTTQQRQTRALMMCFSMALTKATQLYGEGVKVLPRPVCVQHIAMDAYGSTNLVFFQLNTLDVQNSDGIKNMAWFDSEQMLYKKLIPRRAMLRNTQFLDYDPAVLDKMMTMYFLNVDVDDKVSKSFKVNYSDPIV